MADRMPPESLQCEMGALGAALVSHEALEVLVETLVPADFYALGHELIFQTMVTLQSANVPVDKIAVAEALRDRKQLESAGGLPYLSKISNESIGDVATARYYATVVREKAQLRRLIHAGARIVSLAYDGEADPAAAIAAAETAFAAAVDRVAKRSGGTRLYDALIANFERLYQRSTGEVESEGIFAPFDALNKAIGPVMPGEMVLWPAAAKSGKTALLVQLADYFAAHYGHTILVSLEMSESGLSMRYVALYGRVSVRRQREGNLTLDEMLRVEGANATLKARPLDLFDYRKISSLADLRREIRDLSRKVEVRAMVVDGLNFFTDVESQPGGRSTKNDRMDSLYKGLIKIAQEFGIVCHAAQHVNREGMNGPPSLRDIRDGGNPEGHAFAIVSPYRPTPMGKTIEERRDGRLIVLAAREGEAGTIDGMEFIGERSMWIETHGPLAGRPWFDPAPVEMPQMELV